MGFFDKRYHVVGWRGQEHYLTARELYDRVLEDSKSNYNWIASATELVRICNDPTFPQKYSRGIKIAILNCFANLETKKEHNSHCEPTDADVVYACYNSLFQDDEIAEQVKKKYLKAVIKAVTLYYYEFPIHHGPKYKKFCENWENKKFDEIQYRREIDFIELRKELKEDFGEKIKVAEQMKEFEEDDKQFEMTTEKWWLSILSDLKKI